MANGLLFSKNSSGITRALPLGAHRCLARVCVYTHTRTHAHTSTSHVLATWKRDTDSPTIELSRERENSEDKLSREEERTRKRVSRPRESNKFDTRTLSLSLSVCALLSVFKPVLEPRDFIAGLFVPIARTTGRSYSKFSARSVERARRPRLERNGRYYARAAHAPRNARPAGKAGIYALFANRW